MILHFSPTNSKRCRTRQQISTRGKETKKSNKDKTKEILHPIQLEQKGLEDDSFTYLGSVADQQGGSNADTKARLGKARMAFIKLRNVWSSNSPQDWGWNWEFLRAISSQCRCMQQLDGVQQEQQHRKYKPSSTRLRRILPIQWLNKVNHNPSAVLETSWLTTNFHLTICICYEGCDLMI